MLRCYLIQVVVDVGGRRLTPRWSTTKAQGVETSSLLVSALASLLLVLVLVGPNGLLVGLDGLLGLECWLERHGLVSCGPVFVWWILRGPGRIYLKGFP